MIVYHCCQMRATCFFGKSCYKKPTFQDWIVKTFLCHSLQWKCKRTQKGENTHPQIRECGNPVKSPPQVIHIIRYQSHHIHKHMRKCCEFKITLLPADTDPSCVHAQIKGPISKSSTACFLPKFLKTEVLNNNMAAIKSLVSSAFRQVVMMITNISTNCVNSVLDSSPFYFLLKLMCSKSLKKTYYSHAQWLENSPNSIWLACYATFHSEGNNHYNHTFSDICPRSNYPFKSATAFNKANKWELRHVDAGSNLAY